MTGANFNLITVRVKLEENDPKPEQHLDEVWIVPDEHKAETEDRVSILSHGLSHSRSFMIRCKVSWRLYATEEPLADGRLCQERVYH